jgi:predicted nucleic-acid-binding protein
MENRRFCAQAIKYVGQNAKFKTFITDFSVVKLISLMDSNKLPKSEKIAELDSLLSQNTVITLGGTQLAETVNRYRYTDEVKDLEDALQYDLAQKMDCTHIITLNRRDFQAFNVSVIASSKIRSIV